MLPLNRLDSARPAPGNQARTAATLTAAHASPHDSSAAALPFDERLLVFLFDRKQPHHDQHQQQHTHQQQQQQQQQLHQQSRHQVSTLNPALSSTSSRQRDSHYARFRARHIAHFDGGALRLAREAIDAHSAAWLADYLCGNYSSHTNDSSISSNNADQAGSGDIGSSNEATNSASDTSLSDESAFYFCEWDFAGNDALGCAGARALASALVARCRRAQAAAAAAIAQQGGIEFDASLESGERRAAAGRGDGAAVGIVGRHMTRYRGNVPAAALRSLDLSGCGLRTAGFVALANGMHI